VANGAAVILRWLPFICVSSATHAGTLPTAQISDILQSAWSQATARVTGHTTIDGHPVTEVVVIPTFRHEFSGAWPGVVDAALILSAPILTRG